MPVPDYQALMLPLLKLAGDGAEHALSDLGAQLADHFILSADERKELLPSGRQSRFDNRLGWAATYLRKAGLLERTTRGRCRITARGSNTLQTGITLIDNAYLNQFLEFRQFRVRATATTDLPDAPIADTTQTPKEILEASYSSLRQSLADEVLDKVKTCTPRFFERLVVDLLVAMGYGGTRKDAGQAVGQSGDEGIDGIIKEDRLGLDVVYVQAKRWNATVGRPDVQGFAGSLEGQRARKGIFITTSQFSAEARSYVNNIEKKIVLIDGQQLAQYMIDFGVGTAEETTYIVKRLDHDYFDEG